MTFGVRLSVLFLVVLALPASAQLPPTPQSATGDTAGPKLFVPNRFIDLGEVVEGDIVTFHWVLENQGNADLVIEDTKSSCGCTIVDLKEEAKTLKPGEKLNLTAKFDSSGRRGEQRKGVAVYTNDPAEPKMDLTFKASVKWLYQIKPATRIIQLGNLQRNMESRQTVEITDVLGEAHVEIAEVDVLNEAPVVTRVEAFRDARRGLKGNRIFFRMDEDTPLGKISAEVRLKLQIGDVVRERNFLVRANMVGDLTVQPVIVDMTRHKLRHSQRLKPVTVRSPMNIPFEIYRVEAGDHLDVEFEVQSSGKSKTAYLIKLSICEDAPPGPFGSTVSIFTNSIDQPVLKVPVYGEIAEPIEVEPPVILLRQDGTRVGKHRRIRLKGPVQKGMRAISAECDNPAINIFNDVASAERFPHLVYLEIDLAGKLPKGKHETTLSVKTTLEEMPVVEIPVTIVVP